MAVGEARPQASQALRLQVDAACPVEVGTVPTEVATLEAVVRLVRPDVDAVVAGEARGAHGATLAARPPTLQSATIAFAGLWLVDAATLGTTGTSAVGTPQAATRLLLQVTSVVLITSTTVTDARTHPITMAVPTLRPPTSPSHAALGTPAPALASVRDAAEVLPTLPATGIARLPTAAARAAAAKAGATPETFRIAIATLLGH